MFVANFTKQVQSSPRRWLLSRNSDQYDGLIPSSWVSRPTQTSNRVLLHLMYLYRYSSVRPHQWSAARTNYVFGNSARTRVSASMEVHGRCWASALLDTTSQNCYIDIWFQSHMAHTLVHVAPTAQQPQCPLHSRPVVCLTWSAGVPRPQSVSFTFKLSVICAARSRSGLSKGWNKQLQSAAAVVSPHRVMETCLSIVMQFTKFQLTAAGLTNCSLLTDRGDDNRQAS